MEVIATFTYLPLITLVLGVVAGLGAGRYLGLRGVIWLIGMVSVVALALIIWLATLQPGEEARAFMPFVLLTGGVLPSLFAVIMGGVGGRALARRTALG